MCIKVKAKFGLQDVKLFSSHPSKQTLCLRVEATSPTWSSLISILGENFYDPRLVFKVQSPYSCVIIKYHVTTDYCKNNGKCGCSHLQCQCLEGGDRRPTKHHYPMTLCSSRPWSHSPHLHICEHMCTLVQIGVHMCMYICVYVYLCVCVRETKKHMNRYTETDRQTDTQTDTHTHSHPLITS